MTEYSNYNTYKLLGYDMMISNDLKVHVLEVNGRPQLQDHVLDKAVNRPMLAEILRIVGYHIPKVSIAQRAFIAEKFGLGSEYGEAGDYVKNPVSHQYLIYTTVNEEEDTLKQSASKFKESCMDRESYLDSILENITPMDLRTLIKSEEEFSQARHFTRLFPSPKSHQYFKYFYEGLPYYDKLLDAWEHKYANNRSKGIRKLRKYCNKGLHL